MRNGYVLRDEKLSDQTFSDKYWKGGIEEFVFQFHSMDIEDGQDERQQLLINNDRALFKLITSMYKENRKHDNSKFDDAFVKISKLKKAVECLIILQLLGIVTSQFLIFPLRKKKQK